MLLAATCWHLPILSLFSFHFPSYSGYAGFVKLPISFFRNKKVVWLNGVSLLLVILLFVVLGANTREVVSNMLFESNVRKILLEELKAYPGSQLLVLRIAHEDNKNIVRTQINSPFDFSAEDVAKFESKLPTAPDRLPIELRLRHVRVKVMTNSGDRYESHMDENDIPPP